VLYGEFGPRVRVAEILVKCGYKKEADELSARTATLEKEKLKALMDKDMMDGTLQSMTALAIAHEGARSMQLGYRIGYRESLSMTDLIPAMSYESLCKSSLTKAREWVEQAKQ
jgi:hypothetical protein